jgi:thymidylate synthase (FAD)
VNDLIGKEFKVLDKGSIQVIDIMGDDSAVVQAARVSYGKGTKSVSSDRHLIRYLMRNRHTTPFEMCEIKLRVVVPMDCWRQWIRHRTASVNEYSTRYSEAIDDMQTTLYNEWRLQASNNKQGSDGFLPTLDGAELSEKEQDFHKLAREIYQERLEMGVAREQARKDLPLSTYTVAYWKIDLKNLLGFLSLRMDSHAQKEIREYATIIGEEIVAKWVPNTWEAFNDYSVNSTYLTGLESEIILYINGGNLVQALVVASEAGWLNTRKDGKLKRNRERSECEEKFRRLGIFIPWSTM